MPDHRAPPLPPLNLRLDSSLLCRLAFPLVCPPLLSNNRSRRCEILPSPPPPRIPPMNSGPFEDFLNRSGRLLASNHKCELWPQWVVRCFDFSAGRGNRYHTRETPRRRYLRLACEHSHSTSAPYAVFEVRASCLQAREELLKTCSTSLVSYITSHGGDGVASHASVSRSLPMPLSRFAYGAPG